MNSFPQLVHETQPTLLAMGALMFLLAVIELVRWVNRLILSRKRPYEPWLWDASWRRELHDQQPGRVVTGLLGSLIFVALLAAFHGLAYVEVFTKWDVLPSLIVGVVLLIFDVVIFTKLVRPAVLQALALLRFGRMRLDRVSDDS